MQSVKNLSRQLFRSFAAEKAGLPPGTLKFVAPERSFEPTLRETRYNKKKVLSPDEVVRKAPAARDVRWLHVQGIHERQKLLEMIAPLMLGDLILEDILSPHQLPKLEEHERCLIVFVPLLAFDAETGELRHEQITLILAKGKFRGVLSIQETNRSLFRPLEERIGAQRGRIRQRGADYLFYALFDYCLDLMLVTLDELDRRTGEYEDGVLGPTQPTALESLYTHHKNTILLKRIAHPLEKLCRDLAARKTALIDASTRPYLKDLVDHGHRLSSGAQHMAEISRSLIDIHAARLTLGLNETMKFLTLIGTLFIPLTFITGVFGMNFEYMPELKWKWSYPIFWAATLVIGAGMFAWFRLRKWIR